MGCSIRSENRSCTHARRLRTTASQANRQGEALQAKPRKPSAMQQTQNSPNPGRPRCSTACRPHCKAQCLANAARGKHCKTNYLADVACRRHAETSCLANVDCRGHRQTQGVSAHSLSMTESHRSHAAREASRDSRKPSCPAAHEGNHQIRKKPRASNSADAQASQQATIKSAELAGPDQGGC